MCLEIRSVLVCPAGRSPSLTLLCPREWIPEVISVESVLHLRLGHADLITSWCVIAVRSRDRRRVKSKAWVCSVLEGFLRKVLPLLPPLLLNFPTSRSGTIWSTEAGLLN